MDNEQLLDKVQNLLLGMEERINTRFEAVDRRFNGVDNRLNGLDNRLDGLDSRLQTLDGKVDSVRAEVKLHNELLAPFINWSHRIEDEVIRLSAALQDLQARLAKLENPPSQ
jgi:archaellum component FlaC